ncbi:MAG: hypothetical protein JW862_16815 [Anaerolineales bacterium]|nr:hypothetical protein [Anaerolineales bacterium]
MADQQLIGQTQAFVLARGLKLVGDHTALIAHDGSLRFFLELTADPDRPEVRPDLAYAQLLASMQPGWTLRLLRFSWPDPTPRQAFREQMDRWTGVTSDGLILLFEGLALFVESAALPFERRTVLEFAVPASGLPESLAWWESLPHPLGGYGFRSAFLDGDRIQELASWLFNPKLG